MGRRFAFCPRCDRFTWARNDRRTGRYFCAMCGREIPQMDSITAQVGNVSTPRPDGVSSTVRGAT